MASDTALDPQPTSQGEELPPGLALTLYVAGGTRRSEEALARLQAILARHDGEGYYLKIVDVLSDPEHVLSGRVLVTPLLVKTSPEPRQVLVGALEDPAFVIHALGLLRDEAQGGSDT